MCGGGLGHILSKVLPYALDAAAIATGNPELLPLTHAAGSTGSHLIQGDSIGKSLGQGALGGLEAFAGQELLPVAGNAFSSAFPQTASSLGISGGANSLTDLLGQTTGGGSLSGAGTIGGDIKGLFNGSGSPGIGSLLSGAGKSATSFANAPGVSNSLSLSGAGTSNGSLFGSAGGVAGSGFAAPSLASALPTSAGGGASMFGGLTGANTLGTLLGGASSLRANDKAQKDLLDAQNRSIGEFQPYLDSGGAANARLSDLLGTSGNASAAGYGELAKPFTPGDLTQDPGYQFQLKQGTDAINRSLGAKGQLFSGAALKAAQDYGTGLADQTYKDAYARDAQQKAQQYGMYAGQSGAGQGAAASAANIYGNIGNAKANAGIASSGVLNQTLSSLLSGSGAKRLVGYDRNNQPMFA